MSKVFPMNEGNVDRMLRVGIGAGMLAMPVLLPGVLWAWVGLVGVIPLVTGLAGTCPIYTLLGVSTCPLKTEPGA